MDLTTIDRFGRRWDLSPDERCVECGQPDNCGDCNHTPLTELQARHLGVLNSVEDQFLRRLTTRRNTAWS